MKPYIPTLFLMLVISVILSSPCTSADPSDTFQDGCFIYRIVGDDVHVYEYEDDGTVGDITVPDTVEHDGKIYPVTAIYATLWYSGITGVIIGKNVADINDYVFTSDGITHIDVSEENQCYSSVDGVLFSKNGMSLIKYPCGRADETYTVPATVASLDPHSFEHTNIREVVLNDGLVRIGVEAFSNCTNLEHVNSSIGIDTMPSTVAMIADRAFIRCESLREIPIASGIEVVGESAFEYTGIKEVHIPRSLEFIGERAFTHCPNLERFVTDSAYSMFVAFDGVLYRNDSQSYLFCYPAAREGETYEIRQGTAGIVDGAFSGCINLKEVILNPEMVSVDRGAFYDCTSLTTIDLSNIQIINMYAFEDCSNLKEVTFGSKLYYIDNDAFFRSGLESVTLNDSLAGIGTNVFSLCEKLQEVTFTKNCKVTLYSGMFFGDNKLRAVNVEGYDVTFGEWSLSVGQSEENIVTVNVYVKEGYSLPADVCDEYTKLIVIEEGKGPYPYENWVGVFFCVLLILAILMFVREV